MRETKKTNTISPTTTNTTIDTTSQTPIEIILQIDENGMTTASNPYAFLELEPKNFSRWCIETLKRINLPLKMKIMFRSSLRKNVIILNLKQTTRLHLTLPRNYLWLTI